jgi:SAM-dependent methyltransferase
LVVAIDSDFVNLYLAKRYVVPDGVCICMDAEASLPFPDNYFDSVYCMDAFHFIRSKIAVLCELDRVIRHDGLWLFSHMHNALVENFAAGSPLPPREYLRCFEFVPSRLLSEAQVVESFTQEQSLDLRTDRSEEELNRSAALCLVGCGSGDAWQKHEGMVAHVLRARSHLGINPIYQVEEGRRAVHLQLRWPDRCLKSECAWVEAYLPRRQELDRSLWSKIKEGTLTQEDDPILTPLVQTCVLVLLPPGYRVLTGGGAEWSD